VFTTFAEVALFGLIRALPFVAYFVLALARRRWVALAILTGSGSVVVTVGLCYCILNTSHTWCLEWLLGAASCVVLDETWVG
jgi:hypothetical protein